MSPPDDEDVMAAILARSRAAKEAAYAAARQAADAAGKEPFDLDVLDRDWPWNPDNRSKSMGNERPREVRIERWERVYYVEHPTILTMADFVAEMKRQQGLGAFD